MQTTKTLCRLATLLTPNAQEEYEMIKEEILNGIFPWQDIIALANKEFLVPSLYWTLKEKGLYSLIEDEQLKAYLSIVFDLNKERNEKILLQLEEIMNRCDEVNVAPLFLKGAAVLTEGDYMDIGMRSMTDIDIMIPDRAFHTILKHLRIAGYKESSANEISKLEHGHHHWDAMLKEGMPASLELHRYIDKNNLIDFSSTTAEPSKNEIFFKVKILKPTYRLYHAFIHSEISHDEHKTKIITFRHLYDFVVIAHRYKNEVDWTLLEKLADQDNFTKILYSYLYAAEKLFNLKTPLNTATLYSKHHYRMVLIRFNQDRTLFEKLYFIMFNAERIYSYEQMHKIYKINSRFMYPYALTKHFSRAIINFLKLKA